MHKIKIGHGIFQEEIETELDSKGFHVYNQKKAKDGCYPYTFSGYKNINFVDVSIGEIYTIRLFVKLKIKKMEKIDSGLIDIQIISKSENKITGKILTELPHDFPVLKGANIEVKIEELLYEQNY